MNLYQISDEIRNCINEETGEVDVEKLNHFQDEFDSKIESIALWVKDLNAEAKAIKEEEENLTARRKSLENKAESLKRYISSALNYQKWNKSPRVSISFRQSQVVEVEEEKIPKKWFIKQAPKLDKAGIKKALKEGAKVRGAKLVSKDNIQIK